MLNPKYKRKDKKKKQKMKITSPPGGGYDPEWHNPVPPFKNWMEELGKVRAKRKRRNKNA